LHRNGEILSYIIKDLDRIVTMDPDNTIYENKSIAISEDRIVDIGDFSKLRKKWKGFEIIEGKNKIAIPGLIDLHGHSTQSFLKGLLEGQPLMPWLANLIEIDSLMDDEMRKLGIQLTFLEKLRYGVTTSLDMERCVELVVEEAKRFGLRLIEAGVLSDTEELPYSGLRKFADVDEEVKLAKEWYKKYNGLNNGLIEIFFGPVGFPASSPELLKRVAEEARLMNVKIHAHGAEGWVTPELAKRTHGMREIELLEKIGFLGPDVILAHVVQVNDYELQILSKYRTSVAHCPSSNAKLGHGIARIAEMVWHNVPVGIGCDGAASNNSQDLFFEMKIASLMQKARLKNAAILPAKKILEMVTITGAKILGKDKLIGSIEKNKKADIVLINWKKPNLIPLKNIISHLVYNTNGNDVDTVIIDGKIVLENGDFKIPVDIEEIYRKAESKYAELESKIF